MKENKRKKLHFSDGKIAHTLLALTSCLPSIIAAKIVFYLLADRLSAMHS
jgi:hypothetical protein